MRIVVVHNRYRSSNPSGENRVVDDDIAALRAAGIDVVPYIRDSDEIESTGLVGRASLAVRPLVSPTDVAAFGRLLREVRPHVVHLHNPFPLVSPWVVRTARAARVPVVQTVHNYRHACVNGIHFRDGHACTACLDTVLPWPAVRHGCYQGSPISTVPMAVAQVVHRSTWQQVDRFLPVGEAVADHLRRMGIPDERIEIRPNEIRDPGDVDEPGKGVLFVGRLSPEKGVRLLLDAWASSGLGAHHTLTIAGDGELRSLVDAAAATDRSIRALGFLDQAALDREYRRCAIAVVPSECAEADPIAAVTALAHGRAVVGTDLGALPSVVANGCGWSAPATVAAMSAALREALADGDEIRARGAAARQRFETTRARTARPGLVDVYERICAIPRGSIALVGPDGAGKSAVARRLADDARAAGVPVETAHFRPRTRRLTGDARSTGDVGMTDDPHAQVERSVGRSLVRCVVVWASFLRGWCGQWRRAARRGLLVLERPWADQAVDPKRYRLPASMRPVVSRMGRLLPRADVAVLLTGDPAEMHRRKPEIGAHEVQRQLTAWRDSLALVGRAGAEVASVGVPLERTVREVVAAASPATEGLRELRWVRPFGFPARLDLRVTASPTPISATKVYAPQRRRADLAGTLGSSLARLGISGRAGSPPAPVAEVLHQLGIENHALAAFRSAAAGRWIVGVERAGQLTYVLKIGDLDDAALQNEARLLELLAVAPVSWRVPSLRFAGVLHRHRVVVTEAIASAAPAAAITVREAGRIATDLASGAAGGVPIMHGDLAPWNCLRDREDRIVVLDWESAELVRRPLHDLAHFVTQQGVLLGNITPDEAMVLLTDEHSPGAEHVAELGEHGQAPQRLREFLSTTPGPTHPRTVAYRRRLLERLA